MVSVPRSMTRSELIIFMATVIAMSKGIDLEQLNEDDVIWNQHVNLATMIYESLDLRVTKDQRSWPCAGCGNIFEQKGLADKCLLSHTIEQR